MRRKLSPTEKNIGYARRSIGGLEGLIVSIIAQAVLDVLGTNDAHKKDAFLYFGSIEYKEHLTFLGLPVDWMPEAIQG